MRRLPVSVLLLTLVAAGSIRAGAQAPPQANAADFPAGPGREIVSKACRECHMAADITRRRETRRRWSLILDQMAGQGAQIDTDEDWEKVLVYLSTTLGRKVRINTAPASLVAEVFDITEEQAAAIVKARTAKGGFKTWQEIAAVPGIDGKRIQEQQGNLDFSPAGG